MTQLDIEQGRTVTTPFFLIEIQFSSGTVRYSTRQTVTYGVNTYTGNVGAKVTNIAQRQGGSMIATIELQNYDRAISAIILTDGIDRVPAAIRKAYGTGSTIDSTVVLPRFDGMIEGAPDIGDTVRLSFVTDSALTQYTPRILCGPPVFNHIPKTGTVLTWGSEKYILRRQGE